MTLDDWFRRLFGDDEPESFGSGWWSGVLGVLFGVVGLGAVLCLHFPEWLTAPELRGRYPMALVRPAITVVIGLAFGCGLVSGLLRQRKALALAAVSLAIAASVLGGSAVDVGSPTPTRFYLGLDWFLLNLLLLVFVFVPLERLFPLHPEQSSFRTGWTTDLVHLLVSHVGVQLVALVTLVPGVLFFWAVRPELQEVVRAQPLLVALLEIIVLTDLVQYATHRMFHAVPWLWRFHAVHHSSESMDWLAGSRLHLVDILVTRSLSLVPIFLLDFDATAVYAYLVFVSGHAVFIHANVRWKLGGLEPWLVTPRFHHWHHAAEPAAVDKNFAVHVPWLDRLFGSYHCPGDRWPARYGIDGPHPEGGYLDHLLYPFRPRS